MTRKGMDRRTGVRRCFLGPAAAAAAQMRVNGREAAAERDWKTPADRRSAGIEEPAG